MTGERCGWRCGVGCYELSSVSRREKEMIEVRRNVRISVPEAWRYSVLDFRKSHNCSIANRVQG